MCNYPDVDYTSLKEFEDQNYRYRSQNGRPFQQKMGSIARANLIRTRYSTSHNSIRK